MPFGMVNSAVTLKRGMKKLIDDFDGVDYYWDDIIVHTPTWEGHLQALKKLFERLRQTCLIIRPSKCFFGAETIDFLGH